MLSATTIETARLVLTPLVATDAELMVDVLADESMHEFTGGHPLSLEELQLRYQRLEFGRSPAGDEAWLNWIVRLGDDLVPIGVIQATVAADGSAAEVAWEIAVAFRSHGFASEAAIAIVDWLTERRVEQVHACIHPEHAASAVVASRAGLSPTDEWVDGEVVWRRTDQ